MDVAASHPNIPPFPIYPSTTAMLHPGQSLRSEHHPYDCTCYLQSFRKHRGHSSYARTLQQQCTSRVNRSGDDQFETTQYLIRVSGFSAFPPHQTFLPKYLCTISYIYNITLSYEISREGFGDLLPATSLLSLSSFPIHLLYMTMASLSRRRTFRIQSHLAACRSVPQLWCRNKTTSTPLSKETLPGPPQHQYS